MKIPLLNSSSINTERQAHQEQAPSLSVWGLFRKQGLVSNWSASS